MSKPKHKPPAQPIGNPKGRHASPLATKRTTMPPASTKVGMQFAQAPDAVTATMAARGDGL